MSVWLRLRAPLDRAFAGLLLVLLAPVMAIAAALKHLEDRGPAFVRILRAGRQGQPLHMLKIRSMRATGPNGIADGPSITAGKDERITTLGRYLRLYRLDELPQLIHVMQGSMSLIGPRPEAPELVTSDPAWAVVLAARPGIAGPTQLVVEELESMLPAGAAAMVYAEHVLPVKLLVDLWYVANATPLIDARVLLGLAQRFLLGRRPSVLIDHVVEQLPGLSELLLALDSAYPSLPKPLGRDKPYVAW